MKQKLPPKNKRIEVGLNFLLLGCYITAGSLRIMDKNYNPMQRLKQNDFDAIKLILVRKKKGYFISRRALQQLHGNNQLKKIYKQCLK